ncbi:hypothetical protein B0J15DRAFT_523130 [Fusarium solani]|uniref:Uncharacterized protein n=1 Tax=Fusarium solani TaxID=169388 RepID=A0A9P9R7V0_FUSSL|nr:uncharacterized protein B0J15DRAFT_523130 [Fusarium solani]KAH7268553.1 hypothetical protein B0J15DRAFT_523130 [Fusarium solani]
MSRLRDKPHSRRPWGLANILVLFVSSAMSYSPMSYSQMPSSPMQYDSMMQTPLYPPPSAPASLVDYSHELWRMPGITPSWGDASMQPVQPYLNQSVPAEMPTEPWRPQQYSPTYCITCEKQFVPNSVSLLYCSACCQGLDQGTQEREAGLASSEFTSFPTATPGTKAETSPRTSLISGLEYHTIPQPISPSAVHSRRLENIRRLAPWGPESTPPRMPEDLLDTNYVLPTTKDHQFRFQPDDKKEPKATNKLEGDKQKESHRSRSSLKAQLSHRFEKFGSTQMRPPSHDDSDADTTCSVDSAWDGSMEPSEQRFVQQLVQDVKSNLGSTCSKSMDVDYLGNAVKEFACRLQDESLSACGLEAGAIIKRHRKQIVQLLASAPSEMASSRTDQELLGDDGLPGPKQSSKPSDAILDWVSGVQPESTTEISSSAQYMESVQQSDAYRWLLTKILQHDRLSFGDEYGAARIGKTIRRELRVRGYPLKSRVRPRPSMVTMIFNLNWNPVRFFRNLGTNIPYEEALPKILCLVGSWDEAQALTVADYMNQTWPESGQSLITLLQELVSLPEGQECSYETPQPLEGQRQRGLKSLSAIIHPESSFSLTAIGGLHFVSEIGEQLSWLVSALRPSITHGRVMSYIPRVRGIRLLPQNRETGTRNRIASCEIRFEFAGTADPSLEPGLCWGNLFCGPVLVKGFPILKRSIPKTGLEMSLAEISTIIGSTQVVRWDQRIIMKGFNMLAVATLAAADIIVWHLLVSDEADERISYVDPRLDDLNNRNLESVSLRMLEEKRHVVGWCAAATDFCGLQKPPGSIVIDRLYLEAGADVVGGVSMKINSKEQPFWLQRGKDYPSLLKWIGVQPIAFHDVSSRRTWLVDGASALLHLVRISLHLDKNDPDSTYDWVFDSTQLKDKWDGVTGRQAALRTLKSWDNLDLNIYIVDKRRGPTGVPEVQYATFRSRVKEVLHSIELLIDRQSKTVSQEGIRISQSLDPRREIVGFDVLDVVTPLGPILPRVQYLKSWGHGWIDFMPSIGVTTIFGNGFGDLIRPDQPQSLCQGWKSLPKGKDYMAASISTLQMLYEKRILRMDPGLKEGEMAKKIVWASFSHPFRPCNCLTECINKTATKTTNDETQDCHDPVQFFVKKSWPRTVPHGMTPVHLTDLDDKGAVVFGHLPMLSRKSEGKVTARQRDDDVEASSSSADGTLQAPLTTSATSESVGSTGITVPSSSVSSPREEQKEDKTTGGSAKEAGAKRRRWPFFRK